MSRRWINEIANGRTRFFASGVAIKVWGRTRLLMYVYMHVRMYVQTCLVASMPVVQRTTSRDYVDHPTKMGTSPGARRRVMLVDVHCNFQLNFHWILSGWTFRTNVAETCLVEIVLRFESKRFAVENRLFSVCLIRCTWNFGSRVA